MNTMRSPLNLKPDFQGIDYDLASVQMSSRRTELSLHRTRMSADRTLMSIIRTALSLISFGFTIFQFFRYLKQSAGATQLPLAAAKNFGLALVTLGVVMLMLGNMEPCAVYAEAAGITQGACSCGNGCGDRPLSSFHYAGHCGYSFGNRIFGAGGNDLAPERPQIAGVVLS